MSVCIVTRNDGWPVVIAENKEEATEYIEEETDHNVYDVCFFEEDSDGFKSLL
jgi:hypothetical protein